MAKQPQPRKTAKSTRPASKSSPGLSSAPSKTLQGLSRADQKLVAQFGPAAIPDFDEDGGISQRYSAFRFVHQVATAQKVSDPEALESMLFRCLLAALKQGDGTVFQHIANAVDTVAKGLSGKGYFPIAHALLEAQEIPQAFKSSPALLRLWAFDFIPTNAEVLQKLGKNPNDAAEKRSLRRVKAALNLPLTPGRPGAPKRHEKS